MKNSLKDLVLQSLSNKSWLGLLIVLSVMAILMGRDLTNIALGYPDADRILMDGVFILDFLKELPIDRIYNYTVSYFVQYPALSIGYRPPFFPLFEGIFNGFLGVNQWSSRLALLLFAVVGVTAWFKLIERIYNWQLAFWSCLLLITTPFVVQWGWYTMTEIPVLSMALLTALFFYQYCENEKPINLYICAVLFSMTIWTKQPAFFISIWFFLYALLTGKVQRLWRRREVWISIIIVVLMVAPLAIITVWLGKLNIEQSMGGEGKVIARLSWANTTLHFSTLYNVHLTKPILVLSIVGLLWSLGRRDKKSLYFWLLIVSTYLFFTYLSGKNSRYPIFWIPGFTFFAALPLYYLSAIEKPRWVSWGTAVIMLTVLGFQLNAVYAKAPQYATGYDQAARFVLTHSQSPTVFFDGYNNGYFTYFMRALDPQKSMYVLRGDKLLSSSAIAANMWLEVHAHSDQDIRAIFDEYGVQYVVVESRDWSNGIEIHQALRQFLKGDSSFRLAYEVEVDSNRSMLGNQKLLVYEYLDSKTASASSIRLRLPVVGQDIVVPLRDVAKSRMLNPDDQSRKESQ